MKIHASLIDYRHQYIHSYTAKQDSIHIHTSIYANFVTSTVIFWILVLANLATLFEFPVALPISWLLFLTTATIFVKLPTSSTALTKPSVAMGVPATREATLWLWPLGLTSMLTFLPDWSSVNFEGVSGVMGVLRVGGGVSRP